MMLLAKSDGTTLLDHTRHVFMATESLAGKLIPDITEVEYQIALRGSVLHDLGKAHPFFQMKLRKDFDERKYRLEVPHRHEISSLLFLPLFSKTDWPQMIDMVIAHHKSLQVFNDQKGRGLIDLVESYGEDDVFDRHLENWDWHKQVFSLVSAFSYPCREINIVEARNAFDYVVCHYEQKRFGRNKWRGLLMAADHLASALQEQTTPKVHKLFQAPDLSIFQVRANTASADLYPLTKVSVDSPKQHSLVIAPTGSGKTDLLMRRCKDARVFYLLPFQASINAMFLRLNGLLNSKDSEDGLHQPKTDIRRIHASAQIEIDGGVFEEMIMQRHPGASVTIMTPHQLAALIFGLAGHEAIALDIAGQDVILDEIHVYSEQSQAMVLELVKALVRLRCRVHIGSATIPTVLAKAIVECLGGEDNVYSIRLTDKELRTYDRHIVLKLKDETAAREYVRAAIRSGKRVLFISNRIQTAQDRYEWARQEFPDVDRLLIHSRYRRGDRARIEGEIEKFDKMPGPCIVCSTQVVEVSLDISFDTLVTDCAPLDSLVQRFGRVNRKRVPAGERVHCEVCVIAPPENKQDARPYDLETLLRTWNILPSNELLRETDMQAWIDDVYPTIDISLIDQHLVDLASGFKLPELCNVARSVFMEALEIDSASVVRISDSLSYWDERGTERQKLEIPVPISSLRPKLNSWRQINVGSHPFICPDECYDNELGLLFSAEKEPNCIIL